MRFFLALYIGGLLMATASFADHPNEGGLTLEQLVAEAESGSRTARVKEAEMKRDQSLQRSKQGVYFPHLSIEGGPVETRFDGEESSGTALYGKLEWNLYRGGADHSQMRMAKTEAEIAKKTFWSSEKALRRAVAAHYYQLLFLLETQALNQNALKLNQEHLSMAQRKKNSGLTSSSDVLEFELRETILKSELEMIQQKLVDESQQLSALLGRKDLSVITVKGHLQKEAWRPLRESVLALAQRDNLNIHQARAAVAQSELAKKEARSGFLPTIDLEAQYGRLASEEELFRERDNYSLFLKFKLPLFEGLQSVHKTRASHADLAAKNLELEQTELNIRAEIERTVAHLENIQKRLEIEEANLKKSEAYYKITLDEYRRGVKNSPDVIGAAERLLNSRVRNLEYRRDYYVTKLQVYALADKDPLKDKI